MMGTLADSLAGWAHALDPGAEDVALAQRSLTDTAAVALAARLVFSLPTGAQ